MKILELNLVRDRKNAQVHLRAAVVTALLHVWGETQGETHKFSNVSDRKYHAYLLIFSQCATALERFARGNAIGAFVEHGKGRAVEKEARKRHFLLLARAEVLAGGNSQKSVH